MRAPIFSLLLCAGCAPSIVSTGPKSSTGGRHDSAASDSGDTDSTGETSTPDDTADPADRDGDGYDSDEDCNDNDASIHPNAEEVCGDGVDNNCSGTTDEGCPISLGTARASLLGERMGDRAGQSIDAAGDVNGDGFPDLLVGASEHGSNDQPVGRAYVVFGPIPEETRTLSDLPGVVIDGTESGGSMGSQVAGLPDLDGDGHNEVAITSDEADFDGWNNAGRVHIFDGASLSASDGALTVSDAMTTVGGRSHYQWLGGGLNPTGDLDGDGISEIWIGASGDKAGASGGGAIFLVSGADLTSSTASTLTTDRAIAEIIGEQEQGYIGAVMTTPGDMDGDGLDELAIGAHRADRNGELSGAVAVFPGGDMGTRGFDEAPIRWDGSDAGDRLGSDVSTAGDVNEDGYADLWVGAERVDVSYADAGAVMLVYGGPDLSTASGDFDGVWRARLLGSAAGQGLGHTIDATSDLDGDGTHDLLLGTPNTGRNLEGEVRLVLGGFEGSADVDDRAAQMWIGVHPEDRAGWQVMGGGDLLGNGEKTVVISSWESDRSSQDAGEVYVLGL